MFDDVAVIVRPAGIIVVARALNTAGKAAAAFARFSVRAATGSVLADCVTAICWLLIVMVTCGIGCSPLLSQHCIETTPPGLSRRDPQESRVLGRRVAVKAREYGYLAVANSLVEGYWYEDVTTN